MTADVLVFRYLVLLEGALVVGLVIALARPYWHDLRRRSYRFSRLETWAALFLLASYSCACCWIEWALWQRQFANVRSATYSWVALAVFSLGLVACALMLSHLAHHGTMNQRERARAERIAQGALAPDESPELPAEREGK